MEYGVLKMNKEKPLKRKRRQLISGSFIYDEEDVTLAVERLKDLRRNHFIIEISMIDEIFGDFKEEAKE